MTIPSGLESRKDYATRPFTLPDGTITFDATIYLDQWHSIVDAFSTKFKVRIVSFDPHISFANKEIEGEQLHSSDIITIPLWFAERLIDYDPYDDE